MKKLFDDLAYKVSRAMTEKYSTSFSLGILALKPTIRPAVYAVYGYVRLADEIVDSFQGYDQTVLLERLKSDTWLALKEGISINPILQSFQETVNRYSIDHKLIEQFLHSMEMDLNKMDYDEDRYKEYILGSAEVVGLMCLQIFVEGNKEEYMRLKPAAMKLGSAFQKVNFLRDLNYDNRVLGRSYFPDVNLEVFNDEVKAAIEKDIDEDFREALSGIRKLPASSKFGVYLAYKYYVSLFAKIKKTPAHKIMNSRVRIANGHKLSLAMATYVQYKIAVI